MAALLCGAAIVAVPVFGIWAVLGSGGASFATLYAWTMTVFLLKRSSRGAR